MEASLIVSIVRKGWGSTVLEAAVQGRSTWIPSLPVDPKFAALRSEPQYHQLLATLRLPTQR